MEDELSFEDSVPFAGAAAMSSSAGEVDESEAEKEETLLLCMSMGTETDCGDADGTIKLHNYHLL